MKRDPDLIRKILLAVEGAGTEDLERDALMFAGYDDQVIARHVQLLHEAPLDLNRSQTSSVHTALMLLKQERTGEEPTGSVSSSIA